METQLRHLESGQFQSPEDELVYLREQVAQKEKALQTAQQEFSREEIISTEVSKFKSLAPDVVSDSYRLGTLEVEGIVLNLSPEPHDSKVKELLALLKEKGVKNTMKVAEAMDDPHIDDDFHRALVQYIKQGLTTGLKERDPLYRALKSTLYEITLPEVRKEDRERTLKELLSPMEQFYAGMLSVSEEKHRYQHLTLEIAIANHSDEIVFYASVPDDRKEMFEKQVLSIFHNAKLVEKPDDYNIFNEKGVSLGSYASPSRSALFPLKTYESFDHDPLKVLINSFSKIDRDGEGASIQIVFNPMGDFYVKQYLHAAKEIERGVPVREAINIPTNLASGLFKAFREFVQGDPALKNKKKDSDSSAPFQVNTQDKAAAEEIKKKAGSPIVAANVRLIVSAATEDEAEHILSDIESSFNQFENTGFNGIKFKRVEGRRLKSFFKDYSFRMFSQAHSYPLNLKELTSLFHFHEADAKVSPTLRSAKAGSAPAPLNTSREGVLLGVNKHRGVETEVYMAPEDRMRHFYAIGQTGTGKSTLLKNMIIQDILQGNGVCYMDPHGVDIKDILSAIPRERYEDVIYFDPSNTARPMGLNMLEYDMRYPEQKTFVVNEMLSIFNKLFDMKVAGGPMFEQYFRNATMLVIEDPETGNTLLEISRVLADKRFREMKLARCKNPMVVQFWREIAEKAGGEASLSNIVPYITSKFDVFLSNEIMRPIIAQEKSSFNFREIMDSRKILLVNLAKGRLGDINSHLIGLILVGKILMAALSRVDSLHQNLPNFYLYIDEFQNVTTSSISTILSEARKYRLSLTVAHQFIAQLDEEIKNAVFGNVGSIASFRVGPDDAEYLKKQFEPTFNASDLANLDNRNAYVKMLIDGRPAKPFNIETLPPHKGNPAIIEKLQELSALTYGRERGEIEAEVFKRYEVSRQPLSNNINKA